MGAAFHAAVDTGDVAAADLLLSRRINRTPPIGSDPAGWIRPGLAAPCLCFDSTILHLIWRVRPGKDFRLSRMSSRAGHPGRHCLLLSVSPDSNLATNPDDFGTISGGTEVTCAVVLDSLQFCSGRRASFRQTKSVRRRKQFESSLRHQGDSGRQFRDAAISNRNAVASLHIRGLILLAGFPCVLSPRYL